MRRPHSRLSCAREGAGCTPEPGGRRGEAPSEDTTGGGGSAVPCHKVKSKPSPPHCGGKEREVSTNTPGLGASGSYLPPGTANQFGKVGKGVAGRQTLSHFGLSSSPLQLNPESPPHAPGTALLLTNTLNWGKADQRPRPGASSSRRKVGGPPPSRDLEGYSSPSQP